MPSAEARRFRPGRRVTCQKKHGEQGKGGKENFTQRFPEKTGKRWIDGSAKESLVYSLPPPKQNKKEGKMCNLESGKEGQDRLSRPAPELGKMSVIGNVAKKT